MNTKTKLLESGLTYSRYRALILDYMYREKNHPSADVIFEYLKKDNPYMSFASVYNTLHAFEKKGLVREINIQSGKINYDADVSDHHHFLCEKCGKIYDLFEDDLQVSLKFLNQKHDIQHYGLNFFGICESCSDS